LADRLRSLWDFDDLEASEERFRAQLAAEETDAGRAEVLTQLARVEGLRGEFDAGERLVREAESLAGESPVAAVRIDLERGRLLRSGGDPAAALPLFASAYTRALAANEAYLAGDAAHMAALAAPDRKTYVAWTSRGIELAESNDGARYWLGPLLNNLGWEHVEAGEHEEALDAFRRALAAREEAPENPSAIALARYAVGKALRALGRNGEAIPLLEQAVAWADGEGKPDGWFHAELAEGYADAGRPSEAREQAQLAWPLLREADSEFGGSEREVRLRSLAGS
jgi:tetratricopeptide (TPR) repeat protein